LGTIEVDSDDARRTATEVLELELSITRNQDDIGEGYDGYEREPQRRWMKNINKILLSCKKSHFSHHMTDL
jgi:hypothetical protein